MSAKNFSQRTLQKLSIKVSSDDDDDDRFRRFIRIRRFLTFIRIVGVANTLKTNWELNFLSIIIEHPYLHLFGRVTKRNCKFYYS